jgi:hypothetical protein
MVSLVIRSKEESAIILEDCSEEIKEIGKLKKKSSLLNRNYNQ